MSELLVILCILRSEMLVILHILRSEAAIASTLILLCSFSLAWDFWPSSPKLGSWSSLGLTNLLLVAVVLLRVKHGSVKIKMIE